jgi:hypothetical protein
VRIVQYGLKRVRVALNCGRGGPEARNNQADYWDVYFTLMKEIPTALGENNIGGPSSPVSISK